MRKLKYEEITYKQVEHHELEDLILHVYKQEYNIVVGEEKMNDILINHNVKKEELYEYDTLAIREFLEGKRNSYVLSRLMQDMCNKNIIEEENYLINISW